MNKLSGLWLIIIALSVGCFVSLFAGPRKAESSAPHQNQGGLCMWSTAANQFVQVDRVLNGVAQGHNDLFRRVTDLERRITELEGG